MARETRSMYLLDGRRVTLTDLIEAGLLSTGDALRFKRPRLGQTYSATVTEAGTVSLEGGQEFRSPSRAAAVAADMPAVDGWHAWKVASTGRSLDELRQRLLDKVVADTGGDLDTNASPLPDPQRRYEHLKEARSRADAEKPVAITVRELLALWGVKAHGTEINQRIEADLANHGLVTSPNFRKVTIDATVHLITTSQGTETSGRSLTDVDSGDELDVGLTVGNLPSALSDVVSVPPTATFEQAITVMVLNGYSQLAVLAGSHSLRGAVTWQSIAHARHANPNASFADAIVPAREARYDQELIEILPDLETSDFVFVRDEKNAVAGIVTTADVVGVYRELATPFLLIGELDQILRQLIARIFTIEEVISLCDPDGLRPIRAFDDLEMGDYQRVLENRERWQKLGWPLDRVTFIKRLDELRIIRNNVMHFNPEPVPPSAVNKLRSILRLLRDYGGLFLQ